MDQIRLLDVRDTPLSADEVLAAVADPRAGGIALFLGAVRDQDGGRSVQRLGYSAHPLVQEELRRVAQSVIDDFPVIGLAAVHRTGDLEIGDTAVIVAVSCAHRGEAFEAARRLIDDLKATVPVWKHQHFSDGGNEWVGSP
ncbi:MAG: molybdenum cofactor biosynthesis protein MoaE [Actinomycetota bacterium]|nr:molybdenum cofactor biosynthesis protein MoaE [Actinomycetota bacterium]